MTPTSSAESPENRAARLHREAVVIDGASPGLDDRKSWSNWISGGATVATPTIAILEDTAATAAVIGRWYRWLRENPHILLVTSADDVRRAKTEGKLGLVFHFQSSAPLGRNLDLAELFHRLGLRMGQLCYNQRDLVGDGCTDRTDSGLSDYGVAVVREYNRLGILIDLTHAGYQTAMEAAELSDAPVVISHANARALCESRRNIRDDQAKRVAATGGLVGVTALPRFVSIEANPTLEDVLDHIDYFVKLIGADHVAIGMDFYDGGTPELYEELTRTGEWNPADIPPCPHIFPAGMEDARRLPDLTLGLVRRGYSDEDIGKILGGNWLRVFSAAWRGS